MTRPVDEIYRITAPFGEERPLEPKSGQQHHIHGAIDFGTPVGTPILAPEPGTVYYYRALRPKDGGIWPDAPANFHNNAFPFQNYFYDMYGAITILVALSGRCHVFAHSYFRQLYEKCPFFWDYLEQKADGRFVYECMHTFRHPQIVGEGEVIAKTGNAGYTTGPHLHWEIHPNYRTWSTYADRIDPEKFLKGNL